MTGASELKQVIRRWKESALDSHNLCRRLYKNDRKQPLELSRSQMLIFDCIARRQAPDGRSDIHCETHTRFGKSLTAGVATLTRVSTFPEKWTIIAPTGDKKQIIMGYIIEHIGDNQYTKQAFIPDAGESYERLRQHKSKEHITFKIGDSVGELMTLSAQESRKADPLDALMGFGCIVKGDKIATDRGDIEISEIVEQKLPVKILTYNDKENKTEYRNISDYQVNPRAGRDIIEIEVDGRIIHCTEDHPVYIVGKGYIPAEMVQPGDEVVAI